MVEASPSPALATLAPRLRCPHCGASLATAGRTLACARGHDYDVARQGYVSLSPPRRRMPAGDSAEMVAAREAFLGAGHYGAIAAALGTAVRESGALGTGEREACVVDLGAGTGHHLAALLDELPAAWGLALDASRPALRRAARAHPRIAAVACDAWQELPVADGAADVVLNVFAPRKGAEIARVLTPDGALVVVTPEPQHLQELVAPLGMLSVDTEKDERLLATLTPHLVPASRDPRSFELSLTRADVRAAVAMGPSARHVDDPAELERRIESLGEPVRVTASVVVATFRRP